MKTNLGFAITGSFCTHEKIIKEISNLKTKNYNIIPIITSNTKNIDTRFGSAKAFCDKLYEITGNVPIDTIVSAEPLGPQNLIDVLVIAPCTGNTLAKLANAITDNAVTMVTKAQLRNDKPVIIGISTNDALGLNFKNLATLVSTKNIFFVPFGQDDPLKKPKSLIADWSKIDDTIQAALNGKQLQPMLLK